MIKKKRYRKKFASPPGKNIFLLSLVLFAILTWLSIWIVNEGLEPALMSIAEMKTDEFATRAINQAVMFAESYDFEDVANIDIDNNGNVSRIGWDGAVINYINRMTTNRIEEFFKYMNRGVSPEQAESNLDLDYGENPEEVIIDDPTLVEIPLGEITGNTVLANLGPRIPINYEIVGSVRTSVVHDVEDYGINNSLITLYILTEADVQIIIPTASEVTTVTGQVYIDSQVIMGDVPEFYGGGDDGPSISVPRDSFRDDGQ